MGTKETFLVCIEDGNERDFGQVESFTQQIDTDKYIVNALAQVTHNLHTFQSVYVAVDIITLHVVVQQIFRQFFSHSFGEGGDEGTLVLLDAYLDFFHQVVYLVVAGTHLNNGV